MIRYISTRDAAKTPKTFEEALRAGLAPDGGLYVPEGLPTFTKNELKALQNAPYIDVAFAVMTPFVGACIPADILKDILKKTYAGGAFDHTSITPLTQLSPQIWNMELHRGPTLAFKDVALQLLGHLFDHILKKNNERVTIVGATSGDTGSAAIEGCKASGNVDIFILHPKGRVSDVQRRQMTTVQADNVHNIALEGTFDDCQNLVKAMFNDAPFRNDMHLSAINSINWARIMAQVVYYFTAALALGAPDRPVSFSVPTGNFGNVYAAHIARSMGLPIDKLIISTNRNDILTRFFETGEMRADAVEPSLSPSMDIQISSNFERYLFELLGRDAEKLARTMTTFKDTGAFALDESLMTRARADFYATRCHDAQTLDVIRTCYAETGEIIDPHTAVALFGAREAQTITDAPIVSLACAHAAKFPDAVQKATGIYPALPERLADLHERPEKFVTLKNDLQTVQDYIRTHARA